MAYVEAHQELADHPKTKRLMRLLVISRIQAIGHLFLLWWWAQDYAQDGDLSAFEDLDIAEAAEWTGEPAVFVKALQDAGWLDVRQLHDWEQYGGKVFKQRAANAAKVRNWRASHKTNDDSNEAERNGNVTVTSGNVTVPSTSTSLSISEVVGDEGTGEGEAARESTDLTAYHAICQQAYDDELGRRTMTTKTLRDKQIEEQTTYMDRCFFGHRTELWEQAIAETLRSDRPSWDHMRKVLDACLVEGRAPYGVQNGRNGAGPPAQDAEPVEIRYVKSEGMQ